MKEAELKPKYNEIKELHSYCVKIGIKAKIVPLYDGYNLIFPNYADIVQHEFSYYGDIGYLEPAISCARDYTAVTLKEAKKLVRRNKRRLMKGADHERV